MNIARPPEKGDGEQLARGVLRWAAVAAIAIFFYFILSVGTGETRLGYLTAAAIGIVNPVWSLYALAFMGWMYLEPAGVYHMHVMVDALAMGALLGELRLSACNHSERRNWGLWSATAIALLLLIWASAFPGMLLARFHEADSEGAGWLTFTARKAIWGWEGDYQWPLRAGFNWTVGVSLAFVAARRATPQTIARFFLFGAVGLVAACIVGLIDFAALQTKNNQWAILTEIRRPNDFLIQTGRFQGTAGHAGWFAEWIVVMWPGFLFALSKGGRRTRVLAAAGLVLVAWCLVLTGARAAWLGALAGATVAAIFALWKFRVRRGVLLMAAGGVLLLVFVTAALASQAIADRFGNLLRVSDRMNYVASAAIFLREQPLGIGLGLHTIQYSAWFTPHFHYYQADHVTSHNHYLHLLVENGPFVLALFLAGMVALAVQGIRGLRRLDRDAALALMACAAVVAGMLVDGLAQYFFYIRAIEYAFWIAVGFAVGICARQAPVSSASARLRIGLLVAAAIAAMTMLVAHSRRDITLHYPRPWDLACDEVRCNWTKWMPWRLRVPIEPDAVAVSFHLYRKGLPAQALVTWPDGARERFRMGAEGWRAMWRDLDPAGDAPRLAPRRWLDIEVDTAFTPAKWDPAVGEFRPLGLYVHEFNVWYPWNVAEADALRPQSE